MFTSSAGWGIFKYGNWTGRKSLPPSTWASEGVSVFIFPPFAVSQQRTKPLGQVETILRSTCCSPFDCESLLQSWRGLHLHATDFLGHLSVEAGVITTGLLVATVVGWVVVCVVTCSLTKTGSIGRQQRTVPYSQLTANLKSISSIGHESIDSQLQPFSFSCSLWLCAGAKVVIVLTGRIITFDTSSECVLSSSAGIGSELSNK